MVVEAAARSLAVVCVGKHLDRLAAAGCRCDAAVALASVGRRSADAADVHAYHWADRGLAADIVDSVAHVDAVVGWAQGQAEWADETRSVAIGQLIVEGVVGSEEMVKGRT